MTENCKLKLWSKNCKRRKVEGRNLQRPDMTQKQEQNCRKQNNCGRKNQCEGRATDGNIGNTVQLRIVKETTLRTIAKSDNKRGRNT